MSSISDLFPLCNTSKKYTHGTLSHTGNTDDVSRGRRHQCSQCASQLWFIYFWFSVGHVYPYFSFVQKMACCLFRAKQLFETMQAYCKFDLWVQTSVKFESKYNRFHTRKLIWKCCLQNDGHDTWAPVHYGMCCTSDCVIMGLGCMRFFSLLYRLMWLWIFPLVHQIHCFVNTAIENISLLFWTCSWTKCVATKAWIYILMCIYHCREYCLTEMEILWFWWNFHYWMHQMLTNYTFWCSLRQKYQNNSISILEADILLVYGCW